MIPSKDYGIKHNTNYNQQFVSVFNLYSIRIHRAHIKKKTMKYTVHNLSYIFIKLHGNQINTTQLHFVIHFSRLKKMTHKHNRNELLEF